MTAVRGPICVCFSLSDGGSRTANSVRGVGGCGPIIRRHGRGRAEGRGARALARGGRAGAHANESARSRGRRSFSPRARSDAEEAARVARHAGRGGARTREASMHHMEQQQQQQRTPLHDCVEEIRRRTSRERRRGLPIKNVGCALATSIYFSRGSRAQRGPRRAAVDRSVVSAGAATVEN